VINTSIKNKAQTFKINIHFEVRTKVHKTTIFNQNNMKLLYVVMHQQRKKLVQSSLKKSSEQPSFHMGMGTSPLTRGGGIIMRNTVLYVMASLAPSF
jgi:hypothetical protein